MKSFRPALRSRLGLLRRWRMLRGTGKYRKGKKENAGAEDKRGVGSAHALALIEKPLNPSNLLL